MLKTKYHTTYTQCRMFTDRMFVYLEQDSWGYVQSAVQ